MKLKELFDVKSIFYSRKNDIYSLNGIRAISMIWIFSHHYLLQMQVIFSYSELSNYIENFSKPLGILMHGDLGVDIFFILSGFLLTVSLLGKHKDEKKINFKKFYASRALRLIPAYILAIIIYYPFLPNRENLWANLLFVNNFFSFDSMYMVWTGTLAAQEQFYIILPVLLFTFVSRTERKLLFLISLFILSFFLRFVAHIANPSIILHHPADFMYFMGENYSTIYFDKIHVNLYTRYGPMILGVIIAYMHLYHPEKVKKVLSHYTGVGLIFLSFFIVAWFLSISHYKPSEPFSETRILWYSVFSGNLFSLSISVLMLALINSHWATSPIQKFFRLPIWYPIAQISYSMYLFQMLFIAGIIFYAADYLKRNPVDNIYEFADLLFIAGFPLALGLTLLFSLITAVLIERPFMNLRKHPRFRF